MRKNVLVFTLFLICSEIIGCKTIYDIVAGITFLYVCKYGIKSHAVKLNFQLILILILGFIFGGIGIILFNYDYRDIIRDIYRFSLPIIYISFGIYIQSEKKINLLSMYTAIIYSAIFISVRHIVLLVVNFHEVLATGTRNIGGGGSSITELAFFIICFLDYNTLKNVIKSKNKRIVISIVFLSSIFLYSSRTSLIIVGSFIVINIITKRDIKLTSFFNTMTNVILIFALIYCVVPQNTMNFMVDKFERTFTEISPDDSQAWTVLRLGHDYRGFEIYRAKIVLSEANVIEKALGFGFGKNLVYGMGVLVDGTVFTQAPLLHNGYYYILLKTGFLGMALYVWFLVNIIIKNRLISLSLKNVFEARILLGIVSCTVMTTYVVTGPFNDSGSFFFSMMIGFISSYLNDRSKLSLPDSKQ